MATQVARLPSAPHTPSNEWSQDATMSIKRTGNNFSDPTRPRSGPNTPSRELPGGIGSNVTQNVAENVANTFDTVGQTAFNLSPDKLKNALSSKPKGPTGGVGSLPGTPNETEVVVTPLERKSINREKGFTRVHGVGDLPGNDSEISVAKLPDERQQESTMNTQPIATTATSLLTATTQAVTNTASAVVEQVRGTFGTLGTLTGTTTQPQKVFQPRPGGGVGSLPGTPSETSVVKLPLEREVEANKGNTPVRGVGDLPGHPQEAGVAKLPLEKEVEGTLPHGPPVGGVGELPGTQSETSVAKLPAERELEHSSKPTMERAREKAAKPVEKVAEKVKPSSEHQEHDDQGESRHMRKTSTSSSDHAKVGIKDKLKGEIKVITGKITRNEAKVEHGKAIKSGELSAKGAL